MTSVMIDIETFGYRKSAVICQIGACYFDQSTGEIGKTFKLNIDAHSAVQSGAQFDADTVYWWLQQSPEAIKSVIAEPRVPIKAAFDQLNDFLEPAKNIWSHATFDFVTIMETYARLGIKPKFSFKAARDLRTLVTLANIQVKSFPRDGTHHDGLDDSIFQVKYCVAALNKLKSR